MSSRPKICRMGGSVGRCSPRPAGSLEEEEEEDGRGGMARTLEGVEE